MTCQFFCSTWLIKFLPTCCKKNLTKVILVCTAFRFSNIDLVHSVIYQFSTVIDQVSTDLLQKNSHKRATNYRGILREMTYKDEVFCSTWLINFLLLLQKQSHKSQLGITCRYCIIRFRFSNIDIVQSVARCQNWYGTSSNTLSVEHIHSNCYRNSHNIDCCECVIHDSITDLWVVPETSLLMTCTCHE